MNTLVRILTAALMSASIAAAPAAAAPIEYMRVCAAYGPNFFYIPGTDICINPNNGQTRVETSGGTVIGTSALAKDVEEARLRADQATEAVAVSLAIPVAAVAPGSKYAAAANVGIFEGKAAIGVGGAMSLNDNFSFSGSVGVGLQYGTIAGRGGLLIKW